MATIERTKPTLVADEKTMLTAYIDYHRATLLGKLDGLSEDELRRPQVPSGTSLLSLLKHCVYTERGWFQETFAGEDVPPEPDEDDFDHHLTDEDTSTGLIALQIEQAAVTRRIIDGASSLDDRAALREKYSLRYIMTHMVEEKARHNGHADILREMIDGATGE